MCTVRGEVVCTVRGRSVCTVRGEVVCTVRGRSVCTVRGEVVCTVRGRSVCKANCERSWRKCTSNPRRLSRTQKRIPSNVVRFRCTQLESHGSVLLILPSLMA